MKSANRENLRNHGIDFFRIILSIAVVLIHLFHYGGIETGVSPSEPEFYAFWFLGIAIICTVNCFGIISGFVAYNQTYKLTRLMQLHINVIFFAIILTWLFHTLYPGEVLLSDWIAAFFPVSTNLLWYFTGYFGLFFLKPLLIKGMDALSKQQADMLIFFLIIIFSVIPTLDTTDIFAIREGFSVLWLIILFIIGTYLRKYQDSLIQKRSGLIGMYLECTIITWIAVIVSIIYPQVNCFAIMKYSSPTILISAISLVLLFSTMQVSAVIRKITSFFVPLSFCVYIIHEHPLFRRYIMQDSMMFVLQIHPLLQIPVTIAVAVALWLICSFADYLRQQLFSVLKVNHMLSYIESKLLSWFQQEALDNA